MNIGGRGVGSGVNNSYQITALYMRPAERRQARFLFSWVRDAPAAIATGT